MTISPASSADLCIRTKFLLSSTNTEIRLSGMIPLHFAGMRQRRMLMNKILTLGSLFDGSGTFPAAGILSGITPIWASEIEPFPIRVTTKRLPFIKHLGDINHINGAEIEVVLQEDR